MKVSLLLGLVFGCVFSFASQAAGTRKLPENNAVEQKDTGLEVSLVADKRKYKRGERISLEVKLINTDGVKDVFVYGTLEFGYSGSLRLFRRDAKGREVPTRFIDEALTRPPEPNSQSAFVKLLPVHFLGTYYNSTIYLLNMEKPGRYRIWVEYSSPISIADVELKPFFGTESGIIKSNVVWIEVLR
jgi:hypothetical protein